MRIEYLKAELFRSVASQSRRKQRIVSEPDTLLLTRRARKSIGLARKWGYRQGVSPAGVGDLQGLPGVGVSALLAGVIASIERRILRAWVPKHKSYRVPSESWGLDQ